MLKMGNTGRGTVRGASIKKFKTSQEQVVLTLTLCLLIVFSVFLPGFLSVKIILVLLNNISILGILSLGMGLIIIGR